MEYVTLIGFIAGFLTVISSLPQIIKILKLKETRDISIYWAITLTLGATLWLIYGIILKESPIIIANFFTSSFMLIILFLKLKFG